MFSMNLVFHVLCLKQLNKVKFVVQTCRKMGQCVVEANSDCTSGGLDPLSIGELHFS